MVILELYRKTTVDCVNHIIEVVKKSSTAGLNNAHCYEDGKGFQYLDLNSVLGIFFKKLSGLQKYQHFLFEAANPGVVKAQMVANGAYTEFNLLKTRKANVSEITKEIKSFSILVLLWITKGKNIFIIIFAYLLETNSKILLVRDQPILAMNKIF